MINSVLHLNFLCRNLFHNVKILNSDEVVRLSVEYKKTPDQIVVT